MLQHTLYFAYDMFSELNESHDDEDQLPDPIEVNNLEQIKVDKEENKNFESSLIGDLRGIFCYCWFLQLSTTFLLIQYNYSTLRE